MPSDRRRRVAARVTLAALALLAEAASVAGASLARLPGDPVLRQLRLGEPPPPAALGRLIDSRQAALTWRERPADRAVLGLAWLVRAGRMARGGAAEAAVALRRAEDQLVRALRSAPADPHAWARLALVRLRLGDRPGAAAALALSRRTGPRTPELQRVRAALARALGSEADAR